MKYEGQNTISVFGRCRCGRLMRIDRGDLNIEEGKCALKEVRPCPKCRTEHRLIEGFREVAPEALQAEEARRVEEARHASEEDVSVSVPRAAPQVKCPRCRSTQIAAGTKGFGLGKAAVGGLVAGPVGLLAGLFGSKRCTVTCLNCGHSWTPG